MVLESFWHFPQTIVAGLTRLFIEDLTVVGCSAATIVFLHGRLNYEPMMLVKLEVLESEDERQNCDLPLVGVDRWVESLESCDKQPYLIGRVRLPRMTRLLTQVTDLSSRSFLLLHLLHPVFCRSCHDVIRLNIGLVVCQCQAVLSGWLRCKRMLAGASRATRTASQARLGLVEWLSSPNVVQLRRTWRKTVAAFVLDVGRSTSPANEGATGPGHK